MQVIILAYYTKRGYRMSNIPDWARFWKRKGTVLTMVGDLCCMYKATSKRVPGKKNPVPVRTYIGTVTQDGVVVKKDINIDKGNMDVYEAGFTDFVLSSTPEFLINANVNESEEDRKKRQDYLLRQMILRLSTESYISREYAVDKDLDKEANAIIARFQKLTGINFEDIECLKRVYMVVFADGTEARSRMKEDQIGVYRYYKRSLPWEKQVEHTPQVHSVHTQMMNVDDR